MSNAEKIELKILRAYYHHAHGRPLPDPVLPTAPWPVQDEPVLAYAWLHEQGYLEGGMPKGGRGAINTDKAHITEKGIAYMQTLEELLSGMPG